MSIVLRAPAKKMLRQGRPRIDWAHPLANGLIGCWLPGLCGGIDLTGAVRDLAFGQNGTVPTASVDTPEGPALNSMKNSGSGNAYISGLAPPSFKTWSSLSLFWRGFVGTDIPIGLTDLIGIDYDNAISSPFWLATILLDTSNAIEYFWNSGGVSFNSALSHPVTTNAMNSVAGTFTIGGNVVAYINGVQAGTDTFGASGPTSTATSTIMSGSYTGIPTRYLNANTAIVYAWNRALTADEMAWLDQDPYGFLIWDEGEYPALPLPLLPAGGGSDTSRGRAIIFQSKPNKLAFPGGVPGFNPGHIAAPRTRVSAISVGVNILNILTAQTGNSLTFTPPTAVITPFGLASSFQNSADTVNIPLTNVIGPNVSYGAIVTFTSFAAAYQGIVQYKVSGFQLLALNPSNTLIIYAGGDISSGFTPTTNTPYFIAASFLSGSNVNFVVVNLANGSVYSHTTLTATATSISDSSFSLGNNVGQPMLGNIMAAMFSTQYLSMPQLLQWAQDPWSFWYPQRIDLAELLATPIVTTVGLSAPGLLQTRTAPGLGPRSRHTALLNASLPTPAAVVTVTGGTLPIMGVG